MQVTFHTLRRSRGRWSLEYNASFLVLSNELYRLLDKRMHVPVVIDERNDLAVLCKDLLDLP